ncbi:supervillin-like [Arapaima gigas]
MEGLILEPKAEWIARYKAERRRQLTERYGVPEELPPKHVRRETGDLLEPNGTIGVPEGNGCHLDEPSASDPPPNVSSGCVPGRQLSKSTGSVHGGGGLPPDTATTPTSRAPQLQTRVSVGRLKSTLLQQTCGGTAAEKIVDDGCVASTLDLAVKPGSEGRRRPRRYLPGGTVGGRKTSERFRTQPITASEMEESGGIYRCHLFSMVCVVLPVDVKTDDRAKMSVAAKMSLFKELEKNASPEISFLRPRSVAGVPDRRVRRGTDQRALTQPVTSEVVAASQPQSTNVAESLKVPLAGVKPEEEDESSKLTLSEKLALFNKLAQPDSKTSVPHEAADKRRQKGARYRTQPITLDEVDLLQRGPIQLPPLHLSAQLHDRQQALSVNLRPSEVREAKAPPSGEWEESHPLRTPLQQLNCEPREIKGILKKGAVYKGVEAVLVDKHSDVGDGAKQEAGTDTKPRTVAEEEAGNHAETTMVVQENVKGSLNRSCSLHGAPWRQRGRNSSSILREELSSKLSRALPEQHLLVEGNSMSEEGRDWDSSKEGNLASSVRDSFAERCDGNGLQGGILGPEELIETSQTERCRKVRDPENSWRKKAEDEISHDAFVCTLCWEPVLSSVFAPVGSSSQYVICYNQATLSYEAQEVSSPTQGSSETPWRRKKPWAELEMQAETRMLEEHVNTLHGQEERKVEVKGSHDSAATSHVVKREVSTQAHVEAEADRLLDKTESFLDKLESKARSVKVSAEVLKEVTTMDSEGSFGCFYGAVTTSVITSSVSVNTEHDFGAIFQSSTPKLISAVAEHRRSVRPTRKVQASRNPLKALAARDDLRQEYVEQLPNVEQTGLEPDNTLAAPTSEKESHNLTSGAPPFNNLMLIHIKGQKLCRHVQVRLVAPASRSLNSGDCFLLVTPGHCCVWVGKFANAAERAKALEMASFVQSKQDIGCRATQVTMLEEGINAEGSQAADFWSMLGGRTEYRGMGDPLEDEAFETRVVESNCVYRLLDDRLVPVEEAWASMPSVALLSSKEALVFDFGSEVYLWHGQDVSLRDRKMALQLGRQVWAGPYDYTNCRVNPLDPTHCNPEVSWQGEGRPSWALFGHLSQHSETTLFKEKFLDWPAHGHSSREEVGPIHLIPAFPTAHEPGAAELQPCDAKALLAGGGKVPRTILEGVDVNRGHGPVHMGDSGLGELSTLGVDVWHVRDTDEQPLPQKSSGQLHEGDAYAIRWRYTISDVAGEAQLSEGLTARASVRERTAFFFWQGRRYSIDRSRASAFVSKELGGHAEEQVLVLQGKEPPCFLQLFQGGLVIHRGSRRDSASSAGRWRLFCVRGEAPEEAWLLETECRCGSLRSRGSLVLLGAHRGMLYLWHGCKAHASAREVGRRAAKRLTENRPPELGLDGSSGVTVQEVEEGAEPAEFWHALGPPDRKAYDCMLQDPGKYNFTPRLFHLSARSGVFQGKELLSPTWMEDVVTAMPFPQETLCAEPEPALFLLDNRMEVYLWEGRQPGDVGCVGSERPRWERERKCAMETALHYCKERNPRRPPQAYLIFAGSEPLTFTNIFPCWELDTRTDPEGEVPRGKIHLFDQDFQRVLEMKRDTLKSLLSCNQISLKKSRGLI